MCAASIFVDNKHTPTDRDRLLFGGGLPATSQQDDRPVLI